MANSYYVKSSKIGKMMERWYKEDLPLDITISRTDNKAIKFVSINGFIAKDVLEEILSQYAETL